MSDRIVRIKSIQVVTRHVLVVVFPTQGLQQLLPLGVHSTELGGADTSPEISACNTPLGRRVEKKVTSL